MQQQQGARDPIAVRQQTAGSTDFQPPAAPMGTEHAQMGTSGREGARPSEGTDREDHRSPRSHDE